MKEYQSGRCLHGSLPATRKEVYGVLAALYLTINDITHYILLYYNETVFYNGGPGVLRVSYKSI